MSTRGIITLGFGASHYVQMARGLALSIRRLDKEVPLAVVSDRSPESMEPFDIVIPFDESYGSGVTQKLHLDQYSPFDETLFIDSDCILYRPPDELWSFYQKATGFGVAAWGHISKKSDYNFIKDVGEVFESLGVERIPHFNGGVYYFETSESGTSVFETARTLYARRHELGFTTFKNSPVADEPVIGLAMAINGIEPLPFNEGRIMHTAIGHTGHLEEINVLQGISRYKKNGDWFEPAVIHFNIGMQRSYVYRRELYRLACGESFLGKILASILGGAESAYLQVKKKWDAMKKRVSDVGPVGILPGRVLRRMEKVD